MQSHRSGRRGRDAIDERKRPWTDGERWLERESDSSMKRSDGSMKRERWLETQKDVTRLLCGVDGGPK